eukprot:2157313-Pleurochrysis_carterae.AAC.3
MIEYDAAEVCCARKDAARRRRRRPRPARYAVRRMMEARGGSRPARSRGGMETSLTPPPPASTPSPMWRLLSEVAVAQAIQMPARHNVQNAHARGRE